MPEGESEEVGPSEVEINERGKRMVVEAFEEFSLSFEIEKHPDLIQRLVDTREHFQDAHEMAKMIFAVREKLKLEPGGLEKLLTATLLHDIGKSGPPHCVEGSPLRAKVKILFPHGYIPNFPPTFGDFVPFVGLDDDPEKISTELSHGDTTVEVGMKPILFLRLHVFWSYQILKEAGIDEEIVKIVASHHLLEDKNPARLNVEEISSSVKFIELTDKYHAYLYRILALADKVNAIKGRGEKALTHEATIAALRRKVKENETLSDKVKAEYEEIIKNVFEGAEKELDVRVKK